MKKQISKIKMILLVALMGILLGGAYIFSLPAPQGLMILEYHMVQQEVPQEAREYNVLPEDFCQQLDYLQQQGYTTISLRQYLRAQKGLEELPEKPVVLTFDDGYETNYTELLPILEKRGLKATVFMVTNYIGKERYLSWEQLKDMEKRGIEIGSHTANHLPLTEMSSEKALEEIRLSKLLMEWKGLSTIYTFSYPNGKYNASIAELLKDEEYLAAVTGEAGINDFATNPYYLHRINIPQPVFGLWEFRLRLLKGEIFAKLGL